jgi:hypothetical protein
MTSTVALYNSKVRSLHIHGGALLTTGLSFSDAGEWLETHGYTVVGAWKSNGHVMTITVEECATEAHLWPSDVSFLELAHIVEHADLTTHQRQTIATLLHSLDIARNTWDAFPVRYPGFPVDKRNQHLVGTLAALIGRAAR